MVEVVDGQARSKRRVFTVEQKLRILGEYEEASALGRGALLRREKIYTSLISKWRRDRDQGRWDDGLPRRGPAPASPDAKRVASLEAEVTRLNKELDVARQVVKVQGELAVLLETLSTSSTIKPSGSTPTGSNETLSRS